MSELPEPLAAALEAGDADAVAAWFAASSAADRRAARPAILAHAQAMESVDFMPAPSPPPSAKPSPAPDPDGLRAKLSGILRRSPTLPTRRHEVSWMAALGVATARDPVPHTLPHAAHAELLGRALGRAWVTSAAKRLFGSGLLFTSRAFHIVRGWVRAGLLAIPDDPFYFHGMVRSWVPLGMTRAEILRQDPDLLENEFWRLFGPDGQGECSLSACDRYLQPEQTWHAGVLELASTGELDRSRLLDACLDALACDFDQGRAGWYSRLHDALRPTPKELAARKESYLRLLGSRVPPTVALAVRVLKRVRKQDVLTADELLDHAVPAVRARAKQTVVGALTVIDHVASADPARAPDLARLACEALAHEKADVQGVALALIERHGGADDPALCSAIERLASGVAPSLQARLVPWTKAASPAEPAEAFPAEPVVVPLLADARRIEPIDDVPELVAALSSVLEHSGDMDERERVLDGIARLGPAARAQHAGLLQPLAKRLRPLTKRPASERHVVWWETARVAYATATGNNLGPFPLGSYQARYFRFASARCDALVKYLLDDRPVRLLSTPTHLGCWLDPRELVLRAVEDDAADDVHDQVLALLRLAPEHRDLALEAAQFLEDTEFAAALRHALGSDDETVGPTAALWFAAARARAPREVDPKVARVHGRDVPDGGVPAHYTFAWDVGDTKPRWIEQYRDARLVAQVEPEPEADYPAAELLPLLHARLQHCIRADIGGLENAWFLAAMPGLPDPALAHGITAIASDLDHREGAWGGATILGALLEPWLPLEGLAVTLLVFGLTNRGPTIRGLAVDAALQGMETGRLRSGDLGAELAHWLHSGIVKPPRWAATLGEIARTSSTHARFVQRALELALRGDPAEAPRGMLSLFELLQELTATTGAPVSDAEACEYLEQVSAGGKTRKVVRVLLRD